VTAIFFWTGVLSARDLSAEARRAQAESLAPFTRSRPAALEIRTNKLLQTSKILHNQSLASALNRAPLTVALAGRKEFQNSNEQTIERRDFFS
jgi:hypothetical protein